MKIKNINKKKLRGTKFKLMIGAVLLTLGLTGCGMNNATTHNNSNINTPVVEQSVETYDMELNYYNYSVNKDDVETVSVYTKDDKCYRIITPDTDGNDPVTLQGNGNYIYSHTLDQEYYLPTTDDDHVVVVDIDYQTNTISSHLEDKNVKTR